MIAWSPVWVKGAECDDDELADDKNMGSYDTADGTWSCGRHSNNDMETLLSSLRKAARCQVVLECTVVAHGATLYSSEKKEQVCSGSMCPAECE
jgi:hypothetical protein